MPSLLGVVALALVASAALAGFGVRHWWDVPAAIVRGAVQLAALSHILSGIISDPLWIRLALVIMFAVAVAVASGRAGRSVRTFAVMGGAMAAGVVTAFIGVFASGALPLTARFALAVGAIVIGGAMSVSALTSRLFVAARRDHWDEVEGWLALGAPPRRASREFARLAVREALIPSIDQTRTTGLVVLPGAFVGAIFGGLSPFEAARFQIIVLAAILAAASIAAVLVAIGTGGSALRPEGRR
jgi:putative ABC transport system permease protein